MLETTTDRVFGFLDRHKVALTAIVTTAATIVAIRAIAGGAHDDAIEFIKENGLHDAYLSSIEE